MKQRLNLGAAKIEFTTPGSPPPGSKPLINADKYKYIFVGVLITLGMLPFPFRDSQNNLSLTAILFHCITIVVGLLLAVKVVVSERKEDSTFKLHITKLNIVFFLLPIIPIAGLLFNTNTWYYSLFNFNNSVLTMLMLALGILFLTQLYEEREKQEKLLQTFILAFAASTIISFIILNFNIYLKLSLPDFRGASQIITDNLKFLLVVILALIPYQMRMLDKDEGTKNQLLLGVYVISWILLLLIADTNVILFSLLTLVLLSFSDVIQQKDFSTHIFFSVIFIVAFIVSLFIPAAGTYREKVGSDKNANLVASFLSTLNFIKQEDAVLTDPSNDFVDVYIRNQPSNKSNDFAKIYTGGPEIIELIYKYGLIILAPIAILFVYLYSGFQKNIKAIHEGKSSITNQLLIVLIITFFTGVLTHNFNLPLLLLFLPVFSNLSLLEKPVQITQGITTNNIFLLTAIISILGSGVYIIFATKVIRADYLYSKAYYDVRANQTGNIQIKTVESIQKARKINPNEVAYSRDLAQVYSVIAILESQNGNPAGADEFKKLIQNINTASNKTIQLKPESYFAWKARFESFSTLKEFVDAREIIDIAADKMTKLAPNNGENLLAIAAYYQDSDGSRYGDIIRQAYDSNPNVPEIQFEYAKMLRLEGKLEDAKDVLVKMSEVEDKEKEKIEIYDQAKKMLDEIQKDLNNVPTTNPQNSNQSSSSSS